MVFIDSSKFSSLISTDRTKKFLLVGGNSIALKIGGMNPEHSIRAL